MVQAIVSLHTLTDIGKTDVTVTDDATSFVRKLIAGFKARCLLQATVSA